MPHHILFLCHLPPARGGSMHAMELLVKGIADAGHKVTAISPVDAASADVAVDHRRLAPVRVLRFVMPKAGGTFLGYRDEVLQLDMSFEDYYRLQACRALPLMQQIAKDDPPDLIVFGHEVMLWHMVDAVRALGPPVVLMSHGPLSALVNGHLRDELVEPLLDLVRRVGLVLPVAEPVARLLSTLGIRASPVHTIVDTNRFRPGNGEAGLRASLGLDPEDIVVAHASNLRAVKRPMDIVESAALALGQDTRLRYLILGDGPLRADMEQRCRALGIADRVRFAGWVPHREMHRYMRIADLFVLSSASEGMPYGALEPLSCGRALVASELSWTAEVLAEGRSMLLFQPGDVDCLASQTLLAASDRTLRARMGQAGRAYVLRNHHRDGVVRAFMAAVAPLTASADA